MATKKKILNSIANLTVPSSCPAAEGVRGALWRSHRRRPRRQPPRRRQPAEAPAEDRTEFDVVLTAAGDKKIQVIKEGPSLAPASG